MAAFTKGSHSLKYLLCGPLLKTFANSWSRVPLSSVILFSHPLIVTSTYAQVEPFLCLEKNSQYSSLMSKTPVATYLVYNRKREEGKKSICLRYSKGVYLIKYLVDSQWSLHLLTV